jgi:hypothetical protein
MRLQTVHVVSGGLLPLWGVIEGEVAGLVPGAQDKVTKVVRVVLDTDERLVGMAMSEAMVAALAEHLGHLQRIRGLAGLPAPTTEAERPVCPKAMLSATREKKKITSFFKPNANANANANNTAPAPGPARSSAAAPAPRASTHGSSSAGAGKKRTIADLLQARPAPNLKSSRPRCVPQSPSHAH